jgi:hypothetical protein
VVASEKVELAVSLVTVVVPSLVEFAIQVLDAEDITKGNVLVNVSVRVVVLVVVVHASNTTTCSCAATASPGTKSADVLPSKFTRLF